MSSIHPKKSGYLWVRISFYSTSTFYNIPNCYGKIWTDEDTVFPSDDKFLCLEDVVLPMQAIDEKKRPIHGDTNLVAVKNMREMFPGSQGKLYVNTFQIASIMPLDPDSEIVKDLERVTRVSTLPTRKVKEPVVYSDSHLSKFQLTEGRKEKVVRLDRDKDKQTK